MLPSRKLKLKLIQLSYMLHICLDITLANRVETSSASPTIDAKTGADEEFAHLLNRAAASKRIHLISEHTRNGHRLQLEEFLDLDTWNQLLQFKWHEDGNMGDSESRVLSTKKISVIVLNARSKRVIVRYEPYTCLTKVIDTSSTNSSVVESSVDWWKLVVTDSDGAIPRERHNKTIESIMSTASDSPYHARVPIESDYEASVFGVAGLWLKAQYSGPTSSTPAQSFHLANGTKIKNSEAWRLDLDYANAQLLYYFNSALIGRSDILNRSSSGKSNAENDLLEMIELRNLKTTHLTDMINIIDVGMDLSLELVKNLFKLPIGYNCAANPTLSMSGLYFEAPSSRSALNEFETVATRYEAQYDTSVYSSTDVKSLSHGSCKHPINSASSLTLYQILDDRLKLIRDYHSRVEYRIHMNGTTRNHCEINRLHINDFKHGQATEPMELHYRNGIIMNLNEAYLEYLLDFKKSLPDNRYLNQIEVARESISKEELVFESQVPDSHQSLLQILDKQTGAPLKRSLSLVRVYERHSWMDINNIYMVKRRLTPPRLSRLILLVFDHERREKLAEVRFNVVKTVTPLSFARRAQLFDVSQCHRKEATMELVVSYAAETRLIDYALSRSHEVVDEFYVSSINWGMLDGKLANDDIAPVPIKEKQRLGVSLNFLRVPKVELLISSGGELQLKLLVLDKLSPLHLFEQIIESTFVSNAIDERLIVASEEECAYFCRLHNCRMFAYDQSSLECKLSPISVEDQLDDREDGDYEETSAEEENSVFVVRRLTSKIYYAPVRVDFIDSQTPFEEASLAELHSYLEHNAGELDLELEEKSRDDTGQDEDIEDNFMIKSRSTRRDVSKATLSEWPLLSFQFSDRSDPKQIFAPTKRRLLVPSEIKALRVPLTIDVSQGYQRIKVASAFKTQISGKTFRLNLLDDPSWTQPSVYNADERTFFDRQNQIYFSLRRLHLMELDTCALMCYNIDEMDSRAKAEQICQSFSYCGKQKDCTLVVKTDVNFTETLIDLVQEGDQVLDINSTDQLLVDGPDCIVSSRNHLAGFEGPIRLPPGKSGYKSTGYKLPESIEFEWLSVFNIESSEIYEDSQDNCAQECTARNKMGKTCLVLDFCITKIPPNFRDHQLVTKYITNCNLFLLLGDHDPSEDRSLIVSKIRDQLIRPMRTANNRSDDGLESTCNRYLVSHLSEFNHIKLRKISQELSSRLERPKLTMSNLNLDNCAFECSVRRTECLAFEYCNKFDQNTRALQKNCSLFGGLKAGYLPNKKDPILNPLQPVSTYNQDCHIYLRNEFGSLDDLLEFIPKQSSGTAFELGQDNKWLVYCIIFFTVGLVGVFIYFNKSTNRRNHRRFFG